MPSHMHLNVRRNVPVHGSIWESIFPRTFKGYDSPKSHKIDINKIQRITTHITRRIETLGYIMTLLMPLAATTTPMTKALDPNRKDI